MDTVVLDVTVEGDGRGRLEVRWRRRGAGAVAVAVGPTPDHVDHEHPAAVVGDDDGVVLDGLGPGRHYVSVAPVDGGSAVVAAERLVPLEGSSNFRDLGGYPVAGGGRTRWGRVFRSDGLHGLTVEDVARVGQLGLRVVYDLRRDAERARDPSAELPPDVRTVLLAIGGASGKTHEIMDRVYAGEVTSLDDSFLVDGYQRMLVDDATSFGRLLTGLTDPGGLPALFHCSAGKDRTGVAAALLLRVLGVDAGTVVEDYELTSRFYSEGAVARVRPRFAAAGLDVEAFRALFGAPRAAIEGVLTVIDAEHGGIERFLVAQAGVAPETIDELRERLVQPA